jgi:hypothetical protein
MRGADKDRVAHVGELDIIGVLARAGEKPDVFFAKD